MPRSYTVTDPTGVLTRTFNEVNSETGLLVPDENGVYWSIEELDGWDGPDVRQVLVDLYGVDGTIVGFNELASRLLTMTNGFAIAPSEDARWNAELELGQLFGATLALGQSLIVVHEDIDRFAYGYLSSKPEWKEAPPGSAAQLPNAWPFQFEASLICPIPIKRSDSESSGMSLERDGTTPIPTTGNYPTLPTFILAYPCNGDYVIDPSTGYGFTITSTNRGTNDAPPMPTSIEISFQARTCVDQDGNPAWDVIQSLSYFTLKPNEGSSVEYHLGSASPSGTQECYCYWEDAWL
jgi:hypothetical protein